MKIRCYVVDDETDAIEHLKEFIEQTPWLELAGYSQNPLDALDYLTGKHAPELTFLDVDMRQLSGIDLAGMVNLYTSVVITTAFPQFAIQAFEQEAFDYLLKPITYERFLKCVERAKRRLQNTVPINHLVRDEFFNIKSEIKGRMVKIRYDEVVYIEGAQNYVTIHTKTEKHMTYLTIRDMSFALPGENFVRIHRSFIVNINYVKVIERARIRLESGDYLPLGDHYKEDFLSIMDRHLLKTKPAS